MHLSFRPKQLFIISNSFFKYTLTNAVVTRILVYRICWLKVVQFIASTKKKQLIFIQETQTTDIHCLDLVTWTWTQM